MTVSDIKPHRTIITDKSEYTFSKLIKIQKNLSNFSFFCYH